jgi:hypothetical protein
MNKVAWDLKFWVSRLEREDIFRESGFQGNFAIPVGILEFIFSTASNCENPA